MANPRVTAEEHGKSYGKNGKRGSVNNAKRLAGLQQGGAVGGSADWSAADEKWLAAVVVLATRLGLIVSFQLSRDGGAHGLQLYGDGEKVQLWFNQDAQLDIELERVYVYLEGLQ